MSSADENMPDYMERKDKNIKKSGDLKSDIIEKLYTRDDAITRRAMEEDVKKCVIRDTWQIERTSRGRYKTLQLY